MGGMRNPPRWMIGAGLGLFAFALIYIAVVNLIPDVRMALSPFVFNFHPHERCEVYKSLTNGQAFLLAMALVLSLPGRFVSDRLLTIVDRGADYWVIVVTVSALLFVILGALIGAKSRRRRTALTIGLTCIIIVAPVLLLFYLGVGMSCFVT